MSTVPWCHGNDLVRSKAEPTLAAGRVLPEDLVHDAKELFNPLVQSEVLASLH